MQEASLFANVIIIDAARANPGQLAVARNAAFEYLRQGFAGPAHFKFKHLSLGMLFCEGRGDFMGHLGTKFMAEFMDPTGDGPMPKILVLLGAEYHPDPLPELVPVYDCEPVEGTSLFQLKHTIVELGPRDVIVERAKMN